MRVFLWVLCLVLYHQTSGMDSQHPHNHYISHNSSEGGTRVSTICKPRETLVKVEDEFPEMIHKDVVPSCVFVQRCGGCCSDEAVVCVSETKHTTIMQLLQLKQYAKNEQGEMIIELPFVEHSQCQCRFRDQL